MTDLTVSQHLLTRFNVRFDKGYERGQQAGWLDERVELFARYCAPSVANQTLEEFEWLVFFDEETPPAIIDSVCGLDPRIRAILLPPSPRNALFLLYRYLPRGVDVAISTRLDNDDALHRDTLMRVRQQLPRFLKAEVDQWVYNPLLGYKLNVVSGSLHEVAMPDSPFFSMFERTSRRKPAKGALSANHTRIYDKYPTYQDEEERLWIQVVHGGNVSNRVRRWEHVVPVQTLGADFGFAL